MGENGARADRDAVIAELRSADKLIVVTHENPDGDALGSLIATQGILTLLGRDCLMFIVFLSVPLSALLLTMLRRAYPLYPGLTAAIGGLAVAAAAATLLNFFHPYDAAATDLVVHAVAVALVIGANRALGGRIFAVPAFGGIDVTANGVGPN